MTFPEKQQFKATKDLGVKLFHPEQGGSYDVFLSRPISDPILKYCVQDVQCLPRLWNVYSTGLNGSLKAKVELEAARRVWMSQQEDYNGHGQHMAIGPWQQHGVVLTVPRSYGLVFSKVA